MHSRNAFRSFEAVPSCSTAQPKFNAKTKAPVAKGFGYTKAGITDLGEKVCDERKFPTNYKAQYKVEGECPPSWPEASEDRVKTKSFTEKRFTNDQVFVGTTAMGSSPSARSPMVSTHLTKLGTLSLPNSWRQVPVSGEASPIDTPRVAGYPLDRGRPGMPDRVLLVVHVPRGPARSY